MTRDPGRNSDRFSVALGMKSALDRGRKAHRHFGDAVEFPILSVHWRTYVATFLP